MAMTSPSQWLRLHTPPRDVRRWMVDVGLAISHYELAAAAPSRVRTRLERSRERWGRTPDGLEYASILENTLRQGAIGIYSGVLWVEMEKRADEAQ